jgi:uncharacterized protein (DUF1015 family)
MTLVRPFTGLRPLTERAAEVAAPPYDVLSSEEARARAAGKPLSFLHISKAEIDLPPDTDIYSPAVYAKAAENLGRLIDDGILTRDATPCYYAYRLVMGTHSQTGLVVAANVVDYDSNRIRKHEFTRPDKEDDRVRNIEALNAQTGPVLLAYPKAPAIDAMIAEAVKSDPVADVVGDGEVRHTIWKIAEAGLIARITAAFDGLEALYIADGHHRSAAASRVAAARRVSNPAHSGEESPNYFLAVAFPHHEMRILDYNRVVRDLNGLTVDEFLAKIGERFDVSLKSAPLKPQKARDFGLYVGGKWYRLTIRADLIPTDPVARLDVSLLSDHLLGPVLGIADLRRDKRIDFVGGIRGLPELVRRVDSGEMACAFALYPTQMEDLMAVADSNNVMPPKSTWFEPKLADGLVSHVLD